MQTMGLNPDDAQEVTQGTEVLLKKAIIAKTSDNTFSLWPHICVMTANETAEQYEDCINQNVSPSYL